MSSTKDQATDKPLLTGVELARLLGISANTVTRWRRNEGMPFVAIGKVARFLRADVEEWLRSRSVRQEQQVA